MLALLPTLETQYVCPGETHAISRAVHLSRLAAFYPKCRECSHRQELGQLPQPQFEETDSSQPRNSERSLFTLEGVRGVYLNELTRRKAGELSAAFASLLWNRCRSQVAAIFATQTQSGRFGGAGQSFWLVSTSGHHPPISSPVLLRRCDG